ncbi:MAG: TIM barrel protein [Pirellulaceae bacterium]
MGHLLSSARCKASGAGPLAERAARTIGRALDELGDHAAACGVPLVYELLNRYETNLLTTMSERSGFLRSLKTRTYVYCRLIYMNIEEANVAQGLRDAGQYLGHVHFVDSNRRAAGLGHTDFGPIAAALRRAQLRWICSGRSLPLPDSDTAAKKTIESYRRLFKT